MKKEWSQNGRRFLTGGICAVMIVSSLTAVGAFSVTADDTYAPAPLTKIKADNKEDKKELYDILVEAAKKGKKEVAVTFEEPYKNEKSLVNLCSEISRQIRTTFPEYFLDNNISFYYYYNEKGGSEVIFELSYVDITDQEKKAVLDKVDQLVKDAKKQSDDPVEMLKIFRQEICSNTVYDYKAAKSDSDHYPKAYHAYGALIDGKAVCQGYAYALKMLCDKAEIPCWVVTGEHGGPHAWNYVELNGKLYQIDLTMDNAEISAEKSPWFLVGEKKAKDYRIDRVGNPGELAEKSYFAKKVVHTKENK